MAGDLAFITGATGFVGFRVLVDALKAGYRTRISIRRESSIQEIQEHPLIAPYKDSVEFVVVKDITVDGAFDDVLEGVKYIAHVASPLPSATTEDVEKDIIIPAIKGTTSILHSALKFPSVRRVVITSSVVGIIPPAALMEGDDVNTYSASSRISPLPKAPWGDGVAAYRSSKTLALGATERFLKEQRPQFTVVNIMPGYVVGRSELATKVEELLQSTNKVVLWPVLGQISPPRPCAVVDVRDVARIHIESFDEQRVVGNRSFLLNSGSMKFDDAIDVAAKFFPEAVKTGLLPLGGSIPAKFQKLDIAGTLNIFGPLHTFEEVAKEAIGQYLELKAKA